MKNKIIIIEGTDCSGKTTQFDRLIKKLKEDKIKVEQFKFPNYSSPTGKIIGGPYLGKEHISEPYFPEGASKVDAKVASLYYAADRYYNKHIIEDLLSKGHLILDRYVESNLGHQAGKEKDKKKRMRLFKWLDKLEYGMLQLPKPDIKILIYMPYEYGRKLKASRVQTEKLDQLESDEEYLKLAEQAYLELAKLKKFKVVNCVKNNQIRTIDDIGDEIYNYVIKKLRRK